MNKFLLKNKYGFSDKEIELYRFSCENIKESYISAELYKELRNFLENNRWNTILHNKWLTANYLNNFHEVQQPDYYGFLHPKSGKNIYGDPLRNFDEIIETLEKVKKDKIVIKHIGGGKGRSVYIIEQIQNKGGLKVLKLNDGSILGADNFDNTLNAIEGGLQGFILKKKIDTHDILNTITSGGLSSVRIMTIRDAKGNCNSIKAFIRLGSNKGATDHESNGGLISSIDMESGKLGLGQMKGDLKPCFKIHPSSKIKFYGIEVPYWEDSKELAVKAASHIHGVNWIRWDIVIGKNKPYLIEGNVGGGLTTSQRVLGGFIENGILDEWVKQFKIPLDGKSEMTSLKNWKRRFLRNVIKKVFRM